MRTLCVMLQRERINLYSSPGDVSPLSSSLQRTIHPIFLLSTILLSLPNLFYLFLPVLQYSVFFFSLFLSFSTFFLSFSNFSIISYLFLSFSIFFLSFPIFFLSFPIFFYLFLSFSSFSILFY